MAEDREKPIRIVGRTEFTEAEIAAAKNLRFQMEMRIYNMRAMRGDFGTY